MKTKTTTPQPKGTFFAILKAQNPYSSGTRGIEYGWYTNYYDDEITRKDFTANAKQAANNFAEKKFFDTMVGGATAKVFSDFEKFKVEYRKLSGYNPSLH
jgi:hypothetical protein